MSAEPSNEISIVELREISYEDAKIEITEYIRDAGRKVPISELAEKLRISIEVIDQVINYRGTAKEKVDLKKGGTTGLPEFALFWF